MILERINSHLSFKLLDPGLFWLLSEIFSILSFSRTANFSNFLSFFSINSLWVISSWILGFGIACEIFSLLIGMFFLLSCFSSVLFFLLSCLFSTSFISWLLRRPVKCISNQSLGLSLDLIWYSIFLRLLCQLIIVDLFIIFEI